MPLYEYECETCAQRFERIQKFSDSPVDKCPSCAGPVKKLLSSPAIQFKGSGWYITDYPKKGSGESAKADKPAGDSAGKSESASTDKKTETKTDKGSTAKPD